MGRLPILGGIELMAGGYNPCGTVVGGAFAGGIEVAIGRDGGGGATDVGVKTGLAGTGGTKGIGVLDGVDEVGLMPEMEGADPLEGVIDID